MMKRDVDLPFAPLNPVYPLPVLRHSFDLVELPMNGVLPPLAQQTTGHYYTEEHLRQMCRERSPF